ncbi:MAG TPA: DUF190 domain-containing protein, partial [Solirubrobacteraceae bacterium]|nr:DUF190 domain-containing protein [Solirubrobacteraceae bacterium]
GRDHSNRTDLLLSLSDDLPAVAIAVDTAARIEELLPAVVHRKQRGVLTLERARFTDGSESESGLHEEVKLTIYLGRRDRVAGQPAFVAACAALRHHGVDGATVLLSADGTRNGVRPRPRLFGRPGDVPVLVIAIGPADAMAPALAELRTMLGELLATIERVRVCRHNGARVGEPTIPAPEPLASHGAGQKLSVYSSEDDRVDGHPLHRALVRRLRQERIAGATALRGIWGFHGSGEPHGDHALGARRSTPVITVAVDSAERIAAVYPVVEAITAQGGVVTLESVPAILGT